MSQVASQHRRSQSEPKPRASDLEPTTQCLLDLVKTIRHVANHESFTNLETASLEITSLRERDQAYEKTVGQLGTQLKELEASNEVKTRELEERHNNTKLEILRTHREAVSIVENEKKDIEQKLSQALSDIEEKEKKFSELNSANQQISAREKDYLSQRKQAELDLAKTRNEVAELLTKVKEKDDAFKKQKERLEHQGTVIKSHGSDIMALKKEKQALRAELNQSKESLATLNAFALPLQEDNVNQVISQFNSLWQHCIDAVHLCFKTDLRQSILQDVSAWSNLVGSHYVHHHVPLPFTNSIPAKAVRSIVVLTYISQLLVDEIFKTMYLVGRDGSLRQELCILAQDNPRKEAFTRALLISLHDQDYLDAHLDSVVQQAYKLVKELLEPSIAEKFRSDLQSIFSEATDIWRNLQARKSHYEVDRIIPDEPSWLWKTIRLSDTAMAFEEHDVSIKDFQADEVELIVFPRVFIVSPKADIPIFPGRVLQQSQTATVKQEKAQLEENSSPLRSNAPRIERRRTTQKRLSQSEQNGGSFLGSSAGQQRS